MFYMTISMYHCSVDDLIEQMFLLLEQRDEFSVVVVSLDVLF